MTRNPETFREETCAAAPEPGGGPGSGVRGEMV